MLAVLLAPSAWGKFTRDDRQLNGMRAIGFPPSKLWLLGSAEALAILGLIVGLFWWPAGFLASAGLIGYFIGALGYLVHARVTAIRALAPAGAFLFLAIVVLFIRWSSG